MLCFNFLLFPYLFKYPDLSFSYEAWEEFSSTFNLLMVGSNCQMSQETAGKISSPNMPAPRQRLAVFAATLLFLGYPDLEDKSPMRFLGQNIFLHFCFLFSSVFSGIIICTSFFENKTKNVLYEHF